MLIGDNLDLALIAAHLAIIALGVQLGIHNMVVNKFHHVQHRFEVILHVWHFHIADCSAGGKLLELRLKFQLGIGINLLRNMDMIAVGDIILVRNAGDHTETLLQTLGKFIGSGFQRRTVKAEINMFFGLPCSSGLVEVLHHLQGKGCGGRVCVTLPGHILHALIEPGIA